MPAWCAGVKVMIESTALQL